MDGGFLLMGSIPLGEQAQVFPRSLHGGVRSLDWRGPDFSWGVFPTRLVTRLIFNAFPLYISLAESCLRVYLCFPNQDSLLVPP